MEQKYASVHYSKYLQLDKILGAQKLRSEGLGEPAHDEMLFIIIHQAYEIWFKQIIHELNSIAEMFRNDTVDEKNIGIAVHRLDRVREIQKILIDQIRVLETMTSLDFLDFRNYLIPASGFQSFQFRYVELMLGLKKGDRLTYNQKVYSSVFSEEEQKQLKVLEEGKSMFELMEEWLERTPFLEFESFNFLEQYKQAVKNMNEKERKAIQDTDYISEEDKAIRLRMLNDTAAYFDAVLSEERHNEDLKEGKLKMSYNATMAALLINLYRDEPILRIPYQLLTCFVDVDELFTTWRYRHAQMVMRMLGRKIGTGGSSGYEYLQNTTEKHRLFLDLHNISTLLIPRSELPKLPAKLKKELGFYYTSKEK